MSDANRASNIYIGTYILQLFCTGVANGGGRTPHAVYRVSLRLSYKLCQRVLGLKVRRKCHINVGS